MNTTQFVSSNLSEHLGKRAQLGFVVRDMDAMLRFLTHTLNVGPFVVFEESLGDRKFIHRSQVSNVRFSVALGYLGDLQFEVISQANNAASPYLEFLQSGREGLHHIGFWPQNYEAACDRLISDGLVEVSSIETREGVKNISYFDGPSTFGLMLELVPMTPERRRYFGLIQKLAEGWDGNHPIRKFKSRAEFVAAYS